MRSYPIWNEIQACIYKSSKSYGAKERNEVSVKVGTSASNSHNFVNHRTTHKIHEDGTKEFRFFVDDKLIKRAVLKKNSNNLEYIHTK